jgi:hypothetical protein
MDDCRSSARRCPNGLRKRFVTAAVALLGVLGGPALCADGVNPLMQRLESRIREAEAVGIQTVYAQSALTAAQLFKPWIEQDLKAGRTNLVHHNTQVLADALCAADRQLQDWIDEGGQTPMLWYVPELDYRNVGIRGQHLEVDGYPVLLVGPMGWLWQTHRDRDHLAKLGFNQVRIGFHGRYQFDEGGQLIPPGELPFWAVRAVIRTLHEHRVSVGTEMFVPQQIWDAAARRGRLDLDEFRRIYNDFVASRMAQIRPGRTFDYTMTIEEQRAPFLYEAAHHRKQWIGYLREAYADIQELNDLYHADYQRFDQVPFPEAGPANPARRYDWIRFRQIVIAEELARAADVVRRHDPDGVITGYPQLWSVRSHPAWTRDGVIAYDWIAQDPVLDTDFMDFVGCDTAGFQVSERYAMDVIGWMPAYYDLMRCIAGDRPLQDGEFHFANRRRIYPANWARAIFFQAFVHGLDSAYFWVWDRSETIDSAVLYDAGILLGTGQAALDLQRCAHAIRALQDRPNDLVLLYANPSVPHPRKNENERILTQKNQTDRIYEGLYFEGLRIGYVTERQIQNGALEGGPLLIVPNSSHVEKATRDAVAAHVSAGGAVILVGESLAYTPQGLPLPKLPDGDRCTYLAGFRNADTARATLLPLLRKAGIGAPGTVLLDNGLSFPTVEWRMAVDNEGRHILFLLNLGHGAASVELTSEWEGAINLLDGRTVRQSFSLESLECLLLQTTSSGNPFDDPLSMKRGNTP